MQSEDSDDATLTKLTPLKGHGEHQHHHHHHDKSAKTGHGKHHDKAAKARSKFVMKGSPLPSSEDEDAKAKEAYQKKKSPGRQGARYSEGHARYSFDVDVKGPFMSKVDPTLPPPEVKEVGTQAMLFDSDEYDDQNRFSSGDEAGGDAVSSSGEQEDGKPKKKKEIPLVRKPSKRKDAETMARPRGYRDLDLREKMPSLAFDAGTQVGSIDMEKEDAERRGITIPKDNVLWPTVREFHRDSISKITEVYIKRFWKIDPKWMFVIQAVDEYHDHFRKRYVFEVKFSVPSATTPVPPHTASVFFTFELPIYASPHERVKVTYVVEGNRFAHQPGKIPFQDKWLWNLISDKMRVQKAVNF